MHKKLLRSILLAMSMLMVSGCGIIDMIYLPPAEDTAQEIFEAARANNIYVRYFDKPRINNYLRITIGTDEEMKKFLKFLTSFLKSQK